MSLVLCLHISLSNIISLEIHGRIMLFGTIYHAACTCSLGYLMMVPKAVCDPPRKLLIIRSLKMLVVQNVLLQHGFL
jgi:hypothetical protein